MITNGQFLALEEIARSAAHDVVAYTLPCGTSTWNDARVGRMLARDKVIADLLPIALADLRRFR